MRWKIVAVDVDYDLILKYDQRFKFAATRQWVGEGADAGREVQSLAGAQRVRVQHGGADEQPALPVGAAEVAELHLRPGQADWVADPGPARQILQPRSLC